MRKDEVLVLLEGEFVFLELATVRELCRSQLGLEEKRDLVAWQGDVDFDRVPDAGVIVDFSIQSLFACFESEFAEFLGLGDYGKLVVGLVQSSAVVGYKLTVWEMVACGFKERSVFIVSNRM
jgi:hypothetical protein